jgi:hypothetical protein
VNGGACELKYLKENIKLTSEDSTIVTPGNGSRDRQDMNQELITKSTRGRERREQWQYRVRRREKRHGTSRPAVGRERRREEGVRKTHMGSEGTADNTMARRKETFFVVLWRWGETDFLLTKIVHLFLHTKKWDLLYALDVTLHFNLFGLVFHFAVFPLLRTGEP